MRLDAKVEHKPHLCRPPDNQSEPELECDRRPAGPDAETDMALQRGLGILVGKLTIGPLDLRFLRSGVSDFLDTSNTLG
jgi:hypothetical protein